MSVDQLPGTLTSDFFLSAMITTELVMVQPIPIPIRAQMIHIAEVTKLTP